MADQQYKDNLDVAGEWKPRPDPSFLTTAQLMREIASLKEVLTIRIDGIEKASTENLDNLDKRSDARHTDAADRVAGLREWTSQSLTAGQRALELSTTTTMTVSVAKEKAFYDAIDSVKGLLSQALQNIERSVAKSESAITQRFETVESTTNGRFDDVQRSQTIAADAAAKGITRSEVDSKINTLSELANKTISRSEVDAKLDALNEKISGLASRVDKKEGSGSGANNLWVILAAVAMILISIAAVIVERPVNTSAAPVYVTTAPATSVVPMERNDARREAK